MNEPIQEIRQKVAQSCRILAYTGLVREITGHVSHRVPGTPDEMLIRCRGDEEYGLAFTTPDAVRQLRLDGSGPGLGERHEAPLELPIHGEILRARPDVHCVIHAHPPGALLCGIAGIQIRPVVGAFDTSAMLMANAGVPTYPRSVLISRPELAAELIAAMGDRDVCIMRGHGITVTGRSVEDATLRAIRLEAIARVCWELSQRGELKEIPPEDVAEFARRGSGPFLPRADEWVWRHYVRMLEHNPPAPAPFSLS